MAQVDYVVRHGLRMRSHFDFCKFKLTSWFPRHMNRGMLQVQGKLHGIDALIEVHDARIPLCGRNPQLDLGVLKPSILVMNKIDLINQEKVDAIKNVHAKQGLDVVYTNCKVSNDPGIKTIVPKLVDVVQNSNRFNRAEGRVINIMVLGIPNVGKSSLINALRNSNLHRKKAAVVGAIPGVTKCVMEKIQVCYRPPMYIRDTPGVLAPRIPSAEVGLKIALAGTIQDHLVGYEVMADYLLFCLNQNGRYEYVNDLELPHPTDDVNTLLRFIALKKNLFREVKPLDGSGQKKVFPQLEDAAKYFVRRWRLGHFGCGLLDRVGRQESRGHWPNEEESFTQQ